MGILRADRITGLGGANAITGSTHFAGSSNTGNYLRIDTGSTEDFTFGTGDFTFEFWVYSEASGFQQHFYDGRGTTNDNRFMLYMDANNYMYYYGNGSQNITSSSALPKGEWVHVALARASGSTKMYWNGTQTGSTYSDSINFVAPTHGNAFIGSNGGTNGINPTGGGYFNGFLSNYRIVKGTAVYTANFTPPNTRLTAIDGTVLLTCTSSGNVSETEGGNDVIPSAKRVNLHNSQTPPVASSFIPNSPVGFSTTTDVGSQYGTTFDGFGNFATSTYMVPPGGNTRERNRGRGLLMGGAVSPGSTNNKEIRYFDIASQGITETFGETTVARRSQAAVSSSTRGCLGGGFVSPTSPAHTISNIIDFVTIANTGNATDFGDMQDTAYAYAAASNETRGVFSGGYRPNNSAVVNTIDLITIATTGNASNFGDLSRQVRAHGGAESTTRGVFFGGTYPAVQDTIDYITFSTTGDATDFGNLTDARDNVKGSSSSTRAVMGGGRDPSNTNIIDYITIASTGDATDFGDLTAADYFQSATGNSIRAIWMANSTISNAMEFVTIATTGNAVDWGDQNGDPNYSGGACSDSHGGIS